METWRLLIQQTCTSTHLSFVMVPQQRQLLGMSAFHCKNDVFQAEFSILLQQDHRQVIHEMERHQNRKTNCACVLTNLQHIKSTGSVCVVTEMLKQPGLCKSQLTNSYTQTSDSLLRVSPIVVNSELSRRHVCVLTKVTTLGLCSRESHLCGHELVCTL